MPRVTKPVRGRAKTSLWADRAAGLCFSAAPSADLRRSRPNVLPSGSVPSHWILGSEEAKGHVCPVSLIPHPAQGVAQGGLSVDGGLTAGRDFGQQAQGMAESCQLGLLPAPGVSTAALWLSSETCNLQ